MNKERIFKFTRNKKNIIIGLLIVVGIIGLINIFAVRNSSNLLKNSQSSYSSRYNTQEGYSSDFNTQDNYNGAQVLPYDNYNGAQVLPYGCH